MPGSSADFTPPPGSIPSAHYYFNGIDTIRKKTAFARSQGLGGVMIWNLGQDTDDASSLLRAIHAALAGS